MHRFLKRIFYSFLLFIATFSTGCNDKELKPNRIIYVFSQQEFQNVINNNTEIQLAKNITINSPIIINSVNNLVINGNGYGLSSCRKLNNWKSMGGGMYRSQIVNDFNPNVLYEGDKRIVKAREPNAGYFVTQDANHSISKYSFNYDINFTHNIDGLQVYIWSGNDPSWNWFVDIADIKEKKGSNFILKKSTRYKIATGSRFYFQNALELLDTYGEFYYDKNTHYLYVKPYKDISSVCIPLAKNLLTIKNSKDLIIENVTFKETDLSAVVNFKDIRDFIAKKFQESEYDDEQGAVEIFDSENIKIQSTRIRNTGLHGIKLGANSKYIEILDNNLTKIGYTGIVIDGGWKFSSYNFKNIVRGNYIQRFGQNIGHGCGIQIINSGENNISNNVISNGTRYGISLKSVTKKSILNKTLPDYFGGVTIDESNIDNYLKANNNYIGYCDISNVNTDSQDTGLIESWGYNKNNVVDHNVLHNSGTQFSSSNGIYLDLDDYSTGWIVKNNTIENLGFGYNGYIHAAIFIKGSKHTIKNSIIKNIKNPCGVFSILGAERNKDIRIIDNIIVNSGDHIYNMIYGLNNNFTDISGNDYVLKGSIVSSRGYECLNYLTIDQWHELGYD